MMFNKLFALTVGVFFCASFAWADGPEMKLREVAQKIQSLLARQAPENEWQAVTEKISSDLFGQGAFNQLPDVPSSCKCTELGIWSMRTEIKGYSAVVFTWLYRTVEGKKWWSHWEFRFIWRGGRWYLTYYS